MAAQAVQSVRDQRRLPGASKQWNDICNCLTVSAALITDNHVTAGASGVQLSRSEIRLPAGRQRHHVYLDGQEGQAYDSNQN